MMPPSMLHRTSWIAHVGLVAAVVVGSVALEARAAHAAPTQSPDARVEHVVALRVEGARAAEVRKELAEALGESPSGDGASGGVSLVKGDDFDRALGKAGQRPPLGATLGLAAKRGPLLDKVRAALGAVGAEVGVLGLVRAKRGGGSELVLLVLLPGEPEPAIDEIVQLGAGSNASALRDALAPLLEGWKANPAPAESSSPSPEPVEPAEKPYERPTHRYGTELVSGSVSFDLGGRFFTYSDPVSTNLRDYDVFGAPGLALRAEAYPGAPWGIAVLRDLGITGEFRAAFGLDSKTREGTEVGTQWLHYGAGLRYRFPFGDEERPYVVAARGAFVRDEFLFDATGALASEVPGVAYSSIRGGVDARIPLGPVALTAFFDYLGALSAGEVLDRFREPTLGGIDVGGGLVVPIAAGFEARVSAEYVRWFYAFGPQVGDPFVAGGALDENVHLELGPQYVY
jgi:hypothetical protein